MRKLFQAVPVVMLAASLAASPTANEDYVDRQDAQTYTNAVAAAKEYTDSVAGTPPGYADVSNKANQAFSAVSNKLDKGVLSWSGGKLNFDSSTPDDGIYFRDLFHNVWIMILTDGDYFEIKSNYSDWSWLVNIEGETLQDTLDPLVAHLSDESNPHGVTAAQVGAFSSSAGASLQSQVTTIGAHLNAEDARFVVTNYNSVTHTPEAYVEIKQSGEWLRIWREMTRWTLFTGSAFDWDTWGGFYAFKTNIESEVSFKAERNWGMYDSETGGLSPEGYTQISSSNILIAANMAYQKTVTSDGAVWVLQCNSGVATMGGDTNGFFRILDSEGNTQFEIIKGDEREMGADASGITVDKSTSPATLTIPYSIEAADHPTIRVCDNLSSANWKAEGDSACLANVSWSGQSGAYVATVQRKSAGTSLFVQATYMAGGETYIRNVAPVSMTYIMLFGQKFAVGTNTISGSVVLTLTPAQ